VCKVLCVRANMSIRNNRYIFEVTRLHPGGLQVEIQGGGMRGVEVSGR
jgi:hypothetical protein